MATRAPNQRPACLTTHSPGRPPAPHRILGPMWAADRTPLAARRTLWPTPCPATDTPRPGQGVSHEERAHRKCVHSVNITLYIQAHSESHQHLTSHPTVPVSTRPPRLHHLLRQRHPHGTASSRGVRLVLQQATCMHGGGAREQGCGASRSLVNPHHPLQPRPLVIQHARSSRLRPPYRRRYVCRCSRSAAPRRKRHVTACDDV